MTASPTLGTRARNRWIVHLALIVTAIVSLAFEPVLVIHIALGVAFGLLVVTHLAQRRRTSLRLVRQLARVGRYLQPQGRLALSDAALAAFTVAMLVSGFWDWSIGHPTKVRWHAITGVALAGYLLVHTLRRARRLRTSKVS